MNEATAALLTVAAAVALVNWWSRLRHDHRVELVTKPIVTLLLIGASLTIDADPGDARPWFTAALVGCLVGDVMLLPRVNQFIAGLAAFLIGHVLFGVGALVIGVHWAWIPIPIIVAAVLIVPVLRPIVRGSGGMAGPVIAYFAAISTASALLALTGRPWAIFGAVAFVVSDSVLGWDRFVHQLAWAPVTVMVTYHLALAGLVLALV